ncbi:E3 ubiquitin-protein ligase SH3RF1 [Alosa sapidissima]|uniref:E3 ubiquitin-protein ligase SH3RF1 n=1 Tax=Alosa sapidissima TaxID=34773 RepID=UPI001C096451|nr:E3 ubiquitin-protein ligase SH3RF1 [Alosa sapidissima]
MDESALLDLLECPVCLERLDASAKVLPCQHTFCRRCLLGIMGSRGELRCPECRTLVESGVDELPSNILLVRLLDGIKQRPRRPGPGTGAGGGAGGVATAGGCAANGTAAALVRAQATAAAQREPGAPGVQPQRVQAKSTLVRGIPQLPCAKALYNYDGKEPGDLKFTKGDIIILRRQVDENWYHGEMGGVHGFFPTNFVQVVKPLPQPPPQCKALYDFELKDKEADKDCLPFSKDDVLTVIRRVDENWAEGMLGDKIGIFPISYVEVSLTRPLVVGCKRFSRFCVLGQVHICTTGLIVTPPPSSPVTTATVFTFPPETTYASIPVDALPPPPPPPPQSSAAGATSSLAAGQRPSPNANDQSSRQRPTVYVAMFPYSPRKEDELELRKGEMFLVLERCQDGWFKGTSMHTGKMGVFPGNYMSPVSRTVSGGSQPKVPLSLCTQAGRGVTIVSPSTAPLGGALGGVEHPKVLTTCPGPVPPSPLPPTAAVVTAAHMSSGQAKVLMHVTSQMTVNQARNAVRTAACHSQDRPTAAVTPIQSQQAVAFLPHLAVCPQPLGVAASAGASPSCARAGVSLGCAAASLTPPNVSAASLEVDGLRPVAVLAVPIAPGSAVPLGAAMTSASATGNQALPCRMDKDGKREKKGLLKLLSNKKKLRPSPPSSPTLEAEQAVAMDMPLGAAGPDMAACPAGANGGRCGSTSAESEPSPSASGSSESTHRKSVSQEVPVPIAPPPRQPCSSLHALHDSRPIICERYRVVVSYPPQSEAELELKEGDIVFVHRKREDGWFKGTLQRNGRTGLFPGSFVDII